MYGTMFVCNAKIELKLLFSILTVNKLRTYKNV